MTPILLDTDPGVDDALALFLATRSPELEVVAVTTVAGNVGLEATTRNALLLLELAGRPELPVHAGESAAPPSGRGRGTAGSFVGTRIKLKRRPGHRSARSLPAAADVHGGDGLGGITELTTRGGQPLYPLPGRAADPMPAAEAIPRYARARPGEVTLVALGPLTNVARAAQRDREGMSRLREIVVMGGAFRCPGNISPAAEFNLFVDPEAARQLLDMGIPLRFVPLDVTEQVMIRPDSLPRPAKGTVASLVRDLLSHTFGFYEQCVGYAACHLHDPLAVAAVIWPELLQFRHAAVAVECEGKYTRGMTVADLRERRVPPTPNCSFAESVDHVRARDLILGRLFSG